MSCGTANQAAIGSHLKGGSRRKRQSFTYEAFVPDLIASSQPRISFETSALIADADAEIAKLNEDVSVLGFESLDRSRMAMGESGGA